MKPVLTEACAPRKPGAPAATARQITLDKHFAAVGPIQADPGLQQQVLWNLLSNAVKLTPPADQGLEPCRLCSLYCCKGCRACRHLL